MVMVEEMSSAEQTKGEGETGRVQNSVRGFRESERAKMAKTLGKMLHVARREARRRASPGLIRLKWINTVCYLTQTYNGILADTEVNEMRQEMEQLQETVDKLTKERYRWTQAGNKADQFKAGQSNQNPDA